MKFALLSAAAVLFATGGLAMKYSAGMTRAWPSILFITLFAAGASCQAIAMRSAEMGPVYILVLGLEAVAALLLSTFVLGEKLGVPRICAAALIVTGIALLDLR